LQRKRKQEEAADPNANNLAVQRTSVEEQYWRKGEQAQRKAKEFKRPRNTETINVKSTLPEQGTHRDAAKNDTAHIEHEYELYLEETSTNSSVERS
jgi:hypothetical protein